MQFTAQQIAQLIGGIVEGNPEKKVNGIAKIEEANSESISFLANPKYEVYAADTNAGILLVSHDFAIKTPSDTTLIRVENPYACLPILLEYYNTLSTNIGVEQPSFIAENVVVQPDSYVGAFTYIGKGASLGKNIKIYPNCFIDESVSVGDNCILYSGVRIYSGCVIGNNCIIHSNAVIGSDGFGFAPQSDGSFKKIPQTGNVVIEDEVEIGANTVIDRATMGHTLIKKGTKIDNLVQIAHNVELGEHTVIAAQAGISGSTKLGRHVMIGGQAGLVGHIKLADQVKVNAQSGVSKSIEEKGKAVTGSPAFDFREMLRAQSIIKKLPELLRRLELVEKKLNH